MILRNIFNKILKRTRGELEVEPAGLKIIDNGQNNIITIDDDCIFIRSSITIKGNNNSIHLSKVLEYKSLILNLNGNDKKILIKSGKKIINQLKIISIRGNNQRVIIGEDFSCGGMEIQMNDGDEQLTIGDNCLFSWGIKARTSDGHSIIDLESKQPINWPDDIEIGDHVWVSEDVKILKGAKIPKDCVIGASSVVTKKFSDSNCVIAGSPAKIVRTNVTWDHKMPSKYVK